MIKRVVMLITLYCAIAALMVGCIEMDGPNLRGSTDNAQSDSRWEPHFDEEVTWPDAIWDTDDSVTQAIDSGRGAGDKRVVVHNGTEYIVIESHIARFYTELFGEVNFFPVYSPSEFQEFGLSFFLEDNGEILYRLPKSSMGPYTYEDWLVDVYIGDLDMDGLKDIVTVYVWEPPTGVPWHVGFAIYLQRQDGFINSYAFDDYVSYRVGTYVELDEINMYVGKPYESYVVTCIEIVDFILSHSIDWENYF